MDGADWRRDALGAAAFDLGDDVRKHFVERGLGLFAMLGPVALFAMAVGGHAGGFFDDDQMLVEILDFDVVLLRWCGGGPRKHLHHVACAQATPGITACVSVNRDISRLDETADLRPGTIGQPTAQGG